MKYQKLVALIHKRTGALPNNKLQVAALHACRELFFDYQSFYDANQWGDPDVLMDAISWAAQAPPITDTEERKALEEKVNAIIPDTEHFEEPLASYGLNASAAIAELLQFMKGGNKSHIEAILLYYIDTADLKIQHTTGSTESDNSLHPLMISARQKLLHWLD